MLEIVKQFITLITVDQLINNKNYDLALEKLNMLIQQGFNLNDVYFKRGKLCHQLLMNEDAYSDFTYVIAHSDKNLKAYIERMYLNFEIMNYPQAISDSEIVFEQKPEMFDAERIKFLSLIYMGNNEAGKDYLMEMFADNKYKSIQFLLNETALAIIKDEYANALTILDIMELVDRDNPMKMLKEAEIYGLVGNMEKKDEILRRIDSVFPKYFISHFRVSDIYEDRDLLETCFLLELKAFDKQNIFAYPMTLLEGYKANIEGHIIDSRECFERAIMINPDKPEAYVLLGETLQLMSGYDNAQYKKLAKDNYQRALEIYERENLVTKAETMRRQIKHLSSDIVFGK